MMKLVLSRSGIRVAGALLLLTALAGGCAAQRAAADKQDLLDFRDTIKQAKDKVFPAVVFIRCVIEDMQSGRKVSIEANGSGVIISPDGEVLTNWHVVDKATEIRCLLLDGRALSAEVVGTDKDTDLALLKLDVSKETEALPHAAFGNSAQLAEGDFVMAMGAPWGLSRSVSIGIISCTRRYLETNSEYSLWLQTDASISPGNSGGPLVDTAGRIVGINTRGITSGGDVGFSIPSETVQRIVAQLRASGKVNWSWTGLQLQPLKDFNRNTYFEGDSGVIVAGTERESPARRAGIEPRDRILQVGETPVTAMTDEDLPAVRRLLGSQPKGEQLTLLIDRGGETKPFTLTPREKGDVEGEEFEFPRWDLTVKQINQFDNPTLYMRRKEGLFVYGTKQPGNAAESGLRTGDILVAVNGKQIRTPDDLQAVYDKAMENIQSKTKMPLMVQRGAEMVPMVLRYHRDYEND